MFDVYQMKQQTPDLNARQNHYNVFHEYNRENTNDYEQSLH